MKTAICKILDAFLTDHNLLLSFVDVMVEVGAFDEEFDDDEIENSVISHPALRNLNEAEKHDLAIYFRQTFVGKAPREWKEQIKTLGKTPDEKLDFKNSD